MTRDFCQTRARTLHAALLLALLALFWRAVIPGGFMPDWQNGGLVVTLCTEQGLARAVLGPDGTPMDAADATAPGGDCAFASLGLPLLPAAPTALLAASLAFLFLSGRRLAVPVVHRHILRLRPPLRAPPVPAHA